MNTMKNNLIHVQWSLIMMTSWFLRVCSRKVHFSLQFMGNSPNMPSLTVSHKTAAKLLRYLR